MFYRLNAGKVVEIFEVLPVFHPTVMQTILELPDGGSVGQQWDGAQFNTPVEPSKLDKGSREPTQAELLAAGSAGLVYLEKQLETFIDTEVQSRGYRSVNSLGRYMSTEGRFQEEAAALSVWVVAIYELAEDLRDDVLAGTVALPTWPELMAMLPAAPARRLPL